MSISETSEQIDVVRELKRARILFCAVPNGGARRGREARRLKQEGVQAGVPDLLIFDAPPAHPGKVGVALEMKRRDGRPSDVREEQQEWLQALEARGWVVMVGYGRDDALGKLQGAGFDV